MMKIVINELKEWANAQKRKVRMEFNRTMQERVTAAKTVLTSDAATKGKSGLAAGQLVVSASRRRKRVIKCCSKRRRYGLGTTCIVTGISDPSMHTRMSAIVLMYVDPPVVLYTHHLIHITALCTIFSWHFHLGVDGFPPPLHCPTFPGQAPAAGPPPTPPLLLRRRATILLAHEPLHRHSAVHCARLNALTYTLHLSPLFLQQGFTKRTPTRTGKTGEGFSTHVEGVSSGSGGAPAGAPVGIQLPAATLAFATLAFATLAFATLALFRPCAIEDRNFQVLLGTDNTQYMGASTNLAEKHTTYSRLKGIDRTLTSMHLAGESAEKLGRWCNYLSMFGDYSLIWCKGIENGVADWLSRAPLLDGYCPDDGEMETEKYKFDNEGNLIFNEIEDDDDDDEKKMSPRRHNHSLLPAIPNTVPNENRTRVSSASNVGVRTV
jgi:hypothetical protein